MSHTVKLDLRWLTRSMRSRAKYLIVCELCLRQSRINIKLEDNSCPQFRALEIFVENGECTGNISP